MISLKADHVPNSDVTVSKRSEHLQRIINLDIMTINKKINDMDERKLLRKFSWFKYKDKEDMDGYRKQLKLELASAVQRHAEILYQNPNVVPYYVVIDFECTCEVENPPDYRHEIIEFPAILVNSSTLEIVSKFRRFCKPTVKSQLSDFCIELTGIQQKDVDEAEPFSSVLDEFSDWLTSNGLTKENMCFVTDGPWDPCRFLHVQCQISNIEYPDWAKVWLDIRRSFSKFYKEKLCSLGRMLDILGMAFEGRPHCGQDDALNIARVLIKMICDGAVLRANQRIVIKPYNSLLAEEGGNQPIESQLSLSHRDVKVERSRRLHALMQHIDTVDITSLRISEIVDSALSNRKSKQKKKKH